MDELQISNRKYEIVVSFADFTVFEYDIATKKMCISWKNNEECKLPLEVDGVVAYLIEKKLILEGSKEAFRLAYQKMEEGEAEAQSIIYGQGLYGEERAFELKLVNIFDLEGRPIRAIGVAKDITENLKLKREKEFGNAMTSNRQLLYEANVTNDRLLVYNGYSKWGEANAEKDLSFSQLIKHSAKERIHRDDWSIYLSKSLPSGVISTLESQHPYDTFQYRKKNGQGKYEWFEKTSNIIKDRVSGDIIVRCYIENITGQKEKEAKAFKEEKYYETMLSKAVTVYEINLTENIFVRGHENWDAIFNIELVHNYDKMISAFSEKALHPEDRAAFKAAYYSENALKQYAKGKTIISCEYRKLDKRGNFIWHRCALHLFEDPDSDDIRGFAYVNKIHSEKKKELELIYKSQHDMLTGFYNKNTVQEKIESFLGTSDAKVGMHGFFIVDLDFFKNINDHFGHAFGDVVLSKIASKMKALFREDDILGRIGGDEFIIFMKNIQSKQAAITKAREICKNTKEVYTQNEEKFWISSSIGIAIYGEQGKTYEELYCHSDMALYFSKKKGRNKASLFSETMDQEHTIITMK